MGFFSDVSDFIFGGTDTSAQDAQTAANVAGTQAIQQGTDQARTDVLNLFPQAQTSRNLGFQGALDVLSQSIPAQLQAFQQGNVGAQGQIAAGLPQFQAAILGQPTDFSAFQPTTLDVPSAFTSQTLPFAAPGTSTTPEQQAFQTLIRALGGGENFNQATQQGGNGGGQNIPTGSGGSISIQEIGRSIAEAFGQPQQTSAFGVTEINPIANLLAALVPGGSLALGVKGANLSNIQDVQGSLGLEETSLFNALNPFSRLARGASDESLGEGTFGQTTADVTFGGLTEDGRTALTPTEALNRKNLAAAQKKSAAERVAKQAAADKRAKDAVSAANKAARSGGGRGGRNATKDRQARDATRDRNDRAGTGNRQGGFSGRAGR